MKNKIIQLNRQNTSTGDNIDLLNIDNSIALSELQMRINKLQTVKEHFDITKIKERADGSRVYIYINRNMVSASTKAELINKLFELCKPSETLTSIYPNWEIYCKESIGNTAKTIKEHFFIWKNQLSQEPFASKPINDLTAKDFLSYFRRITAKREITYQRFSDIRSVLNGLLYYCVEQELLNHNFISDINCRQFKFKAIDDDVIPYTEEERHKMIDYLAPFNDMYSLAIRLDFCLISRIGEIKALRFDDVRADAYGNIGIKLSRFMDDDSNIQDHIKGNASDGFRWIPLTETALEIIGKIKELNPNSEYMFIKDNRPLTTVTFNRHIKKACEAIGIKYLSSQKVRFSTASIAYSNGLKATELQRLLGHTTLGMTLHYLKNISPLDETTEKFKRALA